MEADRFCLSLEDIDLILQSLNHSRLKVSEYHSYPSQGFKQKQLDAIQSVVAKVRQIKKEMK